MPHSYPHHFAHRLWITSTKTRYRTNSRYYYFVNNKKTLSPEQIYLASTLQDRHGLRIPYLDLIDYDFGKKFIDLFAYDPDSLDMSGLRRVSVIESYLYYDKDQKHLQFKLEMSAEDVAFMVMVLSKYKHNGQIPREPAHTLQNAPPP